jgi:hypothetical protein
MSNEDQDLEILSTAWDIFHSGSFQEALDLSSPLAEDYELAISICILANIKLGNLAEADNWTILAGNQGVRNFWIDAQRDNLNFAILVARLDALSALEINTSVASAEFVTLTQYLFEGFHADLALYNSVNFIRRLWIESKFDELKLATRFYFVFKVEDISDEDISQFLANLGFLLNCSFSFQETEIVMNDLYTKRQLA